MTNPVVSQLKKTPLEIKTLEISDGWLKNINHQPSPHFSLREQTQEVDLLVIHNISLPPRQFGSSHIIDFFQGKLNVDADPYFKEIYQLKVSAHCLIDRKGIITQFVSFNDKAWHAGISSFKSKAKCNDFSIGIELEGTDDIPYTEVQYQQLIELTLVLSQYFPNIIKNKGTSEQQQKSFEHIVGHCDIAPGRKTDPGEAFDWGYFNKCLNLVLVKVEEC